MAVSGINSTAMGGLISGLDTQSILDQMMAARQKQLDKLTGKRSDLTFKKDTIRLFNTQILALQKSVFDLKFSSAFQLKQVRSSNESVVTATAQAGAKDGQYAVKVNQLAQPAQITSNIYSPRLVGEPPNTAGIAGLSGAINGTRAMTIGDVAGDATGLLTSIGAGNNRLDLNVNGTNISIILNNASVGTALSTVVADIESKINAAMNQTKGTSNVNYVLGIVTDDHQIALGSSYLGAGYNVEVKSTSSAASALGFADPNLVVQNAGTNPSDGEYQITISDSTQASLTSQVLTNFDFSVTNCTLNLNLSNVRGTGSEDFSITLNGDYTDLDGLVAEVQSQIDLVAPGRVLVGKTDAGALTFTAVNKGDYTLTLSEATPGEAALLGFNDGATAAGENARAVAVFTPLAGATVTRIVEHKPIYGQDSRLNTANPSDPSDREALAVAINESDSGGPLIDGIIFYNSTLTAGTATIRTDGSNRLNSSSATHATFVSDNDIASTTTLNLSNPLTTAGFHNSPSVSTNGIFTINGKKIKIDDYTTETMHSLMAKINGAGAGVTASYDSVNDRLVLTANTTGSAARITIGAETDTSDFLSIAGFKSGEAGFYAGSSKGSINPKEVLNTANFSTTPNSGIFTINGVSIYVNSAVDSLDDVIEKINSSAAGVIASYNATTDTFSLTSDSTENGRDAISLGAPGDTSNFFYATKLVHPADYEVDSTPSILNTTVSTVGRPGQRALFTVDGIAYNRSTNSINDVIQGVNFELQSVQAPEAAAAILTVTANLDSTIDLVKNFIVEYNKTMQMATAQPLTTNERKNQLPALTKEQSDSLSQDDRDKYNSNRDALRQRDILRQESAVRSYANELRKLTSNPVAGVDPAFNSLARIGISTGAINSSSWGTNPHGMLLTTSTDPDEIEKALRDNSTFMQKLQENPEEVAKLFTQMSNSTLTLTGTQDASSVTLTQETVVRVSNGKQYVDVKIAAGAYTGNAIANEINQALSAAGLEEISFSYNTSTHQIQVDSLINGEDYPQGQAVINLTDVTGSLFREIFGLETGYRSGPKIADYTGISRSLENICKIYTQSNGVLHEKLKANGTIDRELSNMETRITELERRMETERLRIFKQFVSLETYLSQANSQAAWLQSQLATITGESSS